MKFETFSDQNFEGTMSHYLGKHDFDRPYERQQRRLGIGHDSDLLLPYYDQFVELDTGGYKDWR